MDWAETQTKDVQDIVIDDAAHSYGAWTQNDADSHKRVCANNANHVETAGHDYDDSADTTCNDCGYVRTIGGEPGNTDPAIDISNKLSLTVVGNTYTVDVGEYQLASGHSWVYMIDGAESLSDYLWNTNGIAVVPSGTYDASSWSRLDVNNSCTYENATQWSVMLCCDVDENGGVVAYAWLPLAEAEEGEEPGGNEPEDEAYVITLDETDLANGYTEVWFYTAEGDSYDDFLDASDDGYTLTDNTDSAIVFIYPDAGYTFDTVPTVTVNGDEVRCAGNEDGNFWFYIIDGFTADAEIVINGAAVAVGGGNEPVTPPAHEHSYTYTSNNDGTHDGACACGEDAIVNETCTYVNGVCSKCGYTEPVAPTPPPTPGPGPGSDPAPSPTPGPAPDPSKPVGSTDCDGGEECACRAFSDLGADEWYHQGICYAYNNGLMYGVGDKLFEPSTETTRAMVAATLYRMENKPAVKGTSAFEDVADGMWYTDAIAWAAENKIMEGYGGTMFGPNDLVTREQMASIFYRYAKYKGLDTTETTSLDGYTDTDEISSWAVNSMKWASAIKFIYGRTETTFVPQGSTMRSELASFLYRWCTKIAG